MWKKSYWLRRTRRHLALAVVACLLTTALFFATPPPDFRHRLSMGTAYASLILLAFSLLLGPWRVLRRRPIPVSFDLRRDVGIWGGIFALLHTAVGLTVHLRGRMWMYFLRHLHPPALQNTQFGAANYIGAAAALLFVILLAISNDLSLRRLGTRRWKSLQRWAYVAFGLTVAHGILFQRVEKRHLPWVIFFALLVATALILQLLGWIRVRQRRKI
jgi:sulfoxide reductase heme-binding subunit YedZ